MGQCLRGKMAEVGLIPAAPAPAVADAEAPAEETIAAVEEGTVPAEPAMDVTPPVETADMTAEVDQLVAATFGLLRAEPDGSVVIAGSGTPGSRVEVFANGELLGTVEVESSGDWVFVPDTPLPPGGLEITLGEEGKDGTAEDSFIVVINEDKTSQPLVVASKPGEASEVLQGLTPAQVAAAPTAEISAAPLEPAAPTSEESLSPAAPAAEPAEVTKTEVAEAPAEPAEAPAVTEPAATTEAEAVEGQAASESTMQVAALPEAPEAEPTPAVAAPAESTEAEPAAAPETSAEPEAAQPAAEAEQTSQPESQAGAEAETAEAQDTPAATADEPQETADAIIAEAPVVEPAPVQPAAVPPTIDAIEIENDRTFFAGAGPDGGVIRLYVDDAFVADATVEAGRWLVEAGPVLDAPSQRVRVDLLEPGSADVVARAEVDFVVDVPAVEEPVAVAEAPTPATPVTPAPETPADVTAPQDATADAATTQPDTDVSALTEQPAAADPPTSAQDPAANQATVTAETAQTPEPATEPVSTPEPASAVQPAAEPAEETPAVAEPATEPDEPAVPTMVAVSLGDPEAQRFASGKAIIRRGDNLWTIARRVYGEGLKYTTIYQANTGQIRDPDRIYPGQVFNLPEDVEPQ